MNPIEGEETTEIPAKKMVLLPTKCWADTFKCLSRRDLLRSVQPVDKRFHEIAEKRVDNVHVVGDFMSYIKNVEDEKALRQMVADIEGSSASLAQHFKLARKMMLDLTVDLCYAKANKLHPLRLSVQMCVLRNSIELFRGCNLILSLGISNIDPICAPYNPPENVGKNPFGPILALFRAARPWHIGIGIFRESEKGVMPIQWFRQFMNPCELLVMPAVLNCMRLTFVFFDVTTVAKVGRLLEYHLPTAGGDDPNTTTTTAERTRIIILWNVGRNFCSKLIGRCKENLLKAKGEADVRAFVVVLLTSPDVELEPFRLDHSATGEVLRLEQVPVGPDHFFHEPGYVLRRCPAGDLATSDQFYRDTFTPHWKFQLPAQFQKDGIELPPNVALF